jgi:hypothetical protein
VRAYLAVAVVALSGAAPPSLSAQVELTPTVGAYFPTKRVGYSSFQDSGLRVETVTERGDGILLGARAGWWIAKSVGVEGAAMTSSHTQRAMGRATNLSNGFRTEWRTMSELPDVRVNAFSARVVARTTLRDGLVTLLGGLGVAHVRWREGSTDPARDNGTGLAVGTGFRYRLSERAGFRLDVEDAVYSLRFGPGSRETLHGLGLTFGYSLTFRR